MYRDINGAIQRYTDYGVRLIEDIDEEQAIVKDMCLNRYYLWLKCWNRPLSRYGKSGWTESDVLVPLSFKSVADARRYS